MVPAILAAALAAAVGAAVGAAAAPSAAVEPPKAASRPAPVTSRSRPMTSTIGLSPAVDTGTFARYRPFDGREVIVRRGAEMGAGYGLELSRRRVAVKGGTFDLVRYRRLLSPPISRPGEPPPPRDAARRYAPEGEVLYLPDAEVYVPRDPPPDGFTDAEVDRILAAISVA